MSVLKIEIEDSTQAWQEIGDGELDSVTFGTGGAQIIPQASLTFKADLGDLPDVDPDVNPTRPRIRITHGDVVKYFLMEDISGAVKKNKSFPVVTGRAWAGILTDFRPLSFLWKRSAYCSVIAGQVAHRNFDAQSGDTVGIDWRASIDALIPGGRYEVSKKGRLEIVKELAESCGAMVRVSLDGLRLEVVDKPQSGNLVSPTYSFTDAYSLSYRRERCDYPKNAIRVKGLVPDYATGKLPVIKVGVSPNVMDADGTSNATATATVFDENGVKVQHQQIEEPIEAGSYTEIPVSGCYSVQGVWLNTGTVSSPVKGSRVEPTTFNASTITVPDNSTDFFIVSYTRAESVSWSVTDKGDEIKGEEATSTGKLSVSVDNYIGSVLGVYRASDTRRVGTNYFTGGTFTANTKDITLGISPGPAGEDLIVDYEIYNGSPLGCAVSPSSSLCDETGKAQTTVGVGSAAGTAVVTASALGQSGEALLSLKGSAIASMTLTVDPAVLRSVQENRWNETFIENEASDLAGGAGPDGFYFDVDNNVYSCLASDVSIAGGLIPRAVRWEGTRIFVVPYSNQILSTPASVVCHYTTRDDITVPDSTATVSVTAKQANGDPVSDNTPVLFSLGREANGATLSAQRALTSSGEASVTLTAGLQAIFKLVASCGPLAQSVDIKVSDHPEGDQVLVEQLENRSEYLSKLDEALEEDEEGEETAGAGDDTADGSGNLSGTRVLEGCDGPLAGVGWSMTNGTDSYSGTTDGAGVMEFSGVAPGSYTITADGVEREITLAPVGD